MNATDADKADKMLLADVRARLRSILDDVDAMRRGHERAWIDDNLRAVADCLREIVEDLS